MTDSEAYTAYVADVINNKSLSLFGALLRIVCTRAGITQTKLGRDSKDHLRYFKEKGWMPIKKTADVGQSAISDASRGELEPSFYQLRIWLYAIRQVYEAPDFALKCQRNGMPVYAFSEELERDIWYLALKGREREICNAYERRRNMALELTRVEWRNGIEPRWRDSPLPPEPPMTFHPESMPEDQY